MHSRALNEHATAAKFEFEENVKFLTTWIQHIEKEVHKSKQKVKKVVDTAGRTSIYWQVVVSP